MSGVQTTLIKSKTVSSIIQTLILCFALSGFYTSTALAAKNSPSLSQDAELASIDKDAAVDAQSDVESIKANLDDAEGGLGTSQKELAQAKLDLVQKTKLNKETVARLTAEIKKLNTEQVKNTSETARLTAQIVKLQNEISKIEYTAAETRAKADVVKTKLLDTKASHEQSSTNRQQTLAKLKDVQAEMKKGQNELNQKKQQLKVALAKESAANQTLKKTEMQSAKMQTAALAEGRKIDQQVKIALQKAELNEKKAKLAEQKRLKALEVLKQKRQKLSEAQSRLKKSVARTNQTNRVGSN